MVARELLWCVVMALGSFGATFVALGMRRERGRGRAPTDLTGGLRAAMESLPVVATLRERAERAHVRADCLRQMPVMLDVVTLGLSAGLSFDSSLELYCQRYQDRLARELGGAMLAWRLGTCGREEAIGELARRLDVSALDRFAGVVCQALAFGAPLATTLEQQAQAIREEQRAQMEEEVERAPVKMLIPLGTLIVPAMLLSILGPLLGASLTVG